MSSPSNNPEYELKFCTSCGVMTNHLGGLCQKGAHPNKPGASNNLKEQVEAILDAYTALNEGEFKGQTQKWWSFAVEPAANQVVNLILDTILAGEPGKMIGYTDKQDKFAVGYAHAVRDFKAMLEGMRK